MAYAIDQNETKEVALEGVAFLVGHMPHGVYKRLLLEQRGALDMARRRAIAALAHFSGASSGEAIEEAALQDPQYVEESDRCVLEMLRWGVKGHRGLAYADGSEVPFLTQKERYLRWQFDVVDDPTLRIYEALGSSVAAPLYMAVLDFNTLSERDRKNSQPQLQ